MDPLYVAYWNQFPDPVDVENGIPSWLIHFESHSSKNTTAAEDLVNQVEDESLEEEDSPIFEKYMSPTRQIIERIPQTKLDFSQLPLSAVNELSKHTEIINACQTQREQIVLILECSV